MIDQNPAFFALLGIFRHSACSAFSVVYFFFGFTCFKPIPTAVNWWFVKGRSGPKAPRTKVDSGLWIFEFLQIYGEKSCCWTMAFYQLLPRLGLQLHQYKSYSAWWYHCPYRRLFRLRLACERRSIVGKCTGCGTPRQVSDAWLMSWVGNFLNFLLDFLKIYCTFPEANIFRTWKWIVGRWKFLLGRPILRGYVSVSGRVCWGCELPNAAIWGFLTGMTLCLLFLQPVHTTYCNICRCCRNLNWIDYFFFKMVRLKSVYIIYL